MRFLKYMMPWFLCASVTLNFIFMADLSNSRKQEERGALLLETCTVNATARVERIEDEHERALDNAERGIWSRYDQTVNQVLAAARLRFAHPELPHPEYGTARDRILDPANANQSHDLFPVEAADVRAAEGRLEQGYLIMTALGRGSCDRGSMPFPGLWRNDCVGSGRATGERRIRSLLRAP